MHRRPSILAHRPKTSSAADDTAGPKEFEASMKRTASQMFNVHHHDARDAGVPLASVKEGMRVSDYPSSHRAHTSSLSRASAFAGGSVKQVKQICRRLSSSSSSSSSTRRPSLHNLFDPPPPPPPSNPSRKASTDLLRTPLHHQDSGIPPFQQEGSAPAPKLSMLKRSLSTITRRRPATSGPSGDAARCNPLPPPIPANYPCQAPGTAARQAAAAANDARRRDLDQLRLLEEYSQTSMSVGVIKDNESGVGMSCCSPVESTDAVQEKKMVDPLQVLPAEISTLILSNLDAPSLVRSEAVSKLWNEAAASPHVWRNVFLRRYEPEVHVSPTPIQMGGAGIGKFLSGKPAPAQDWKAMYRARTQIHDKWRAGSHGAIYLNGHTDSVYCCQFDESKIITGSRDRTIRVWDMKTNKCTKVIGGPAHRPQINTPPQLDTKRDFTIADHPSMNGTPGGNAIYHVPADYHDASILCLQYDDEIMVTGSSDHTCIVWDITGDNYVPLYRLRGHQAGVLDVCLDDKHIISCSKDSAILVWDRQTGKHLRTLNGHRGPVNAVQLRGNLLVSASGDGVAKLWNLDSGVCIRDFPSEDRGLAAVEFSDDAKYVLAGGNDHVVYKFETATGNLDYKSEKHGGLVRSLFLDAFNGNVVSGSYDQSIRIWDYETGETFCKFENWTTSWILSAKSDYRRVVATSQDGRALILDFGYDVKNRDLLVGGKFNAEPDRHAYQQRQQYVHSDNEE